MVKLVVQLIRGVLQVVPQFTVIWNFRYRVLNMNGVPVDGNKGEVTPLGNSAGLFYFLYTYKVYIFFAPVTQRAAQKMKKGC